MWVVAVPVYHCYLSNAIALPPLVGKPSGGLASQTYLDPLSKFQASTTSLFFLTNAAVRTLHGFIQCSAANSCLNSELVKFSHSSVFCLHTCAFLCLLCSCPVSPWSPTWPRGPCPSSSSTWAARWCTSLISDSELKPLSPTRHLRWWEWKGKW